MTGTWARFGIFGAALLAPLTIQASLQGQMGSTTTQQTPTMPGAQNPTTPGVSGVNPYGQDSSASNAGGADAQGMKDKIFLRKSAQSGLAEIMLGKLAAQKGSTEEVRRFGQKMADDHTILNETMKPIADQMGVRVPSMATKIDLAEYDMLNGMSGLEFDREYLAYTVKDHHQGLRDYRDEVAGASDPVLKEAVEKGHKIIAEHTRMLDKLAVANGLPVPLKAK